MSKVEVLKQGQNSDEVNGFEKGTADKRGKLHFVSAKDPSDVIPDMEMQSVSATMRMSHTKRTENGLPVQFAIVRFNEAKVDAYVGYTEQNVKAGLFVEDTTSGLMVFGPTELGFASGKFVLASDLAAVEELA